jgi:hypothetical protein
LNDDVGIALIFDFEPFSQITAFIHGVKSSLLLIEGAHNRDVGNLFFNTNLPFDQLVQYGHASFPSGRASQKRTMSGCIFRLTFAGVFNIFSMASQTLYRCREKIFILISNPLGLGSEVRPPRMGCSPARQRRNFSRKPPAGKTVQKEHP